MEVMGVCVFVFFTSLGFALFCSAIADTINMWLGGGLAGVWINGGGEGRKGRMLRGLSGIGIISMEGKI